MKAIQRNERMRLCVRALMHSEQCAAQQIVNGETKNRTPESMEGI